MAELTDRPTSARQSASATPRPLGLPQNTPAASAGCRLRPVLGRSTAMCSAASLYADTETAAGRRPWSASLGCGVPTAVADLHEGETVLDLGSGAGADVLISARRVGPAGRVIGLDMTDEMLALARANAAAAGVENVEFVKGYIEDIPLPDASVDVVISNCVINLAADKRTVLAEAARVLRPGGRFAVSDVIADPDMDEATRADMAAWTGCIAGALTEAEFRARARRRRARRHRDPPDAPRARARELGDRASHASPRSAWRRCCSSACTTPGARR